MATNSFLMAIPQYFGNDASLEAGKMLKGMGCTKVMVLHFKSAGGAGIEVPIIETIRREGIEVLTDASVVSDPDSDLVTRIGQKAREEDVNGIVAIGGGSIIDAGKGVKLLLSNKGDISDYYPLTTPQAGCIPMIAIPTTSGTGSEASKGTVITDSKTGIKKVIIGPGTTPDAALIDPKLTLGVPPKVTAACAFDALSHAIDAILSTMTNRIVQGIAYEGIRLMKNSYKRAVEHGDDLEARSDMHLAANYGGIVLANAKCNMCHAFAHALGALYHVPHGTCCAIFTPACLEFLAEERPEEIREIARLLDVPFEDGESAFVIARRTGEEIHRMYRSVGLEDITAFVPSAEEAIERIIPVAEKDIMARFSPRKLDQAGAEEIIRRTFELAEGGVN